MIILFSIVVFILLAYIYFLKIEIRNISNQLRDYNEIKTRKKINVNLLDKDIENLAININDHIDRHIQVNISQKKLKMAIANISHDIRTPLTAILGYLQMCKNNTIT